MSDGEAFEPVEDIVTEAKRAGAARHQPGDGGLWHDCRHDDSHQGPGRVDNAQEGRERQHRDHPVSPGDSQGGGRRCRRNVHRGRRHRQGGAASNHRSPRCGRRRARRRGGETKTPRYQWFLFPALVLLLIDTALIERRGRRARRPAAAETAAAVALTIAARVVERLRQPTRERSGPSTLYRSGQFVAVGFAVPRRDHGRRQEAGDAVRLRHGARRRATRCQSGAEALGRLDGQQGRRTALSHAVQSRRARISSPVSPRPRVRTMESWTRRSPCTRRRFSCGPATSTQSGTTSSRSGRKRAVGAAGVVVAAAEERRTNRRRARPRSRRAGSGQQQADQLLGSAAREERDVQSKKQKTESRGAAAGRKGLVIGASSARRTARDRRARAGYGGDVRGASRSASR